jgi:hypothetical protein
VNCIWLVTVLCILYTLVLFGIFPHATEKHGTITNKLAGSSRAFNAVLGSFTLLVQISYAYPMVILLYRGRSTILPVGDWHLGKYGAVAYVIGVGYCVFTFVIFMFPVNMPVTAQNMSKAPVPRDAASMSATARLIPYRLYHRRHFRTLCFWNRVLDAHRS